MKSLDRGWDLSPEYSEKVDDICDAFEAAWLASNDPRIEEFIADADQAYSVQLFEELLAAEWDLCERDGRSVELVTYQDRFPQSKHLIAQLHGKWCEAVERECHADSRSGGRDGSSHLSIRCPNCHHLIHLAADSSFSDVTCPVCGSQFSLTDGDTESQDAAGLTMVGHFELVERLGIGAFGTVWKARDTKLQRTVAIKIPRKGQLDTEEIEKFLREARITAQLRHPNVLTVHEVGRDGDTVYIVSDLLRGVTLSDWLTGDRMTAREAADLCAKILDALHHAHEVGVIHRDLKPQNVMLDSDRQPHLMDFGLARRDAGEVTMTLDGHVLGTPAYMSPEQARGEAHRADRRTDIYSLGVVLFQLLTGELPFRGNSRMLIHQVLNEDVPSPRRLNGTVARDLETICLKCLEKEPAKRYETAHKVAEELRRYLTGEPIKARRISISARVWRWSKRNPVRALLVTLLAVLAVVGPIVAMNQTRLYRTAESEREKTYRLLYISDMNLAIQAWDDANLGQVLDILDRHPSAGQKDHRGFEWFYLRRQIQHGLSTRTIRFDSSVHALAVSPHGDLLAVGGRDSIVGLYDAHSLDPVGQLEVGDNPAWSLEFSSDGSQLATASWREVKLWDVASRQELLSKSDLQSDVVWCVAFSPDDTSLAIGSANGTITLLDVGTGKTRSSHLHTGDAHDVAFSSDGRLATCSNFDGVKLSDLDFENIWSLDVIGRSLAFSPDGETLAVNFGSSIVLIDKTGKKRREFQAHRGDVLSVAFSPDGSKLATCGMDNTVRLWDLETGYLLMTLRGHLSSVQALAFSADGLRLFSGGLDGRVKAWSLTSDHTQERLPYLEQVLSVDFSRDGELVTSCDDGKIRLWEANNLTLLFPLIGHAGRVHSARFFYSGGETFLASASADGTVNVWHHQSRQLLQTLPGYRTDEQVLAVASAAGVLAWPQSDRTLRVWSFRKGDVCSFREGFVHALELSPDGRLLAAGCSDLTVGVWDVVQKKLVVKLAAHASLVSCLKFSSDGNLLITGGEDRTLRLWDVQSLGADGEQLPIRTFAGHGGTVTCAAFSPDGRTLASGAEDQTVRLWDLETGEQRGTLKGHTNMVADLTFSPDGNTLVSAGADKTVRLWRAAKTD